MVLVCLFFTAISQAGEGDFGEKVAFLELIQGYYNLVESTHRLHSNPESATILHIFTVQEAYKEQGEAQRAIVFPEETLKRIGNHTIRGVIYSMLVDLNEETGDPQTRLELLQTGLDEALSRLRWGLVFRIRVEELKKESSFWLSLGSSADNWVALVIG